VRWVGNRSAEGDDDVQQIARTMHALMMNRVIKGDANGGKGLAVWSCVAGFRQWGLTDGEVHGYFFICCF
jgi:hypothetical protein